MVIITLLVCDAVIFASMRNLPTMQSRESLFRPVDARVLDQRGVIASTYRLTRTFWPWLMVIIGGTGNYRRILAGTAVFVVLGRTIDAYRFILEPIIPFCLVWPEER